MNLKLNKNV
uniref:Uncharacterized protein n=1 Tax=Anguilla anguilla TaxID=7936 RepID=A0A0E9QDW0_ANGAN